MMNGPTSTSSADSDFLTLQKGFIESFLSQNKIDNRNAVSDMILHVFKEIQEARNQSLKYKKTEFQFTTRRISPASITDSVLKGLKIFESFGCTITKSSSLITQINVNATAPIKNACLAWNFDTFQDRIFPSQYFCQKLGQLDLNALDRAIYEIVKEFNLTVNDARYTRIYSAVSLIIKELQSKTSYWNWTSPIKIERFSIDLNDDSFLMEVARKLNIFITIVNRSEYQDFEVKGKVYAPGFTEAEKPLPPLPKILPLKLDPECFPDIQFKVEGKVISMHKVVLSNCPIFAKRFQDKEINLSPTEPIPLDFGTYRAYKELQHFLYNDKQVSQECLKNLEINLEVYQLANSLEMYELEYIIKEAIRKNISPSGFLKVVCLAERFNDEYLQKLCLWFAHNASLENQIDLSIYSSYDLFQLKAAVEKYGLISIEKNIDQEITKKIALDKDFISICEWLVDKKDKIVTDFFNTLLAKHQLVQQLKENQNNLPAQWKAYKHFKLES